MGPAQIVETVKLAERVLRCGAAARARSHWFTVNKETGMRSFARSIVLAVVLAAGSAPASMAAAETISQCYDRVLTDCTEALESARWWEKPAIGALCTLMLVGCSSNGLQ